MGHGSIRISAGAHGILRELSRAEGKPMLALLDEAVETLRRQRSSSRSTPLMQRLRADARTWETIEGERRAWDVTSPTAWPWPRGARRYEARSRPKRSRKRR